MVREIYIEGESKEGYVLCLSLDEEDGLCVSLVDPRTTSNGMVAYSRQAAITVNRDIFNMAHNVLRAGRL